MSQASIASNGGNPQPMTSRCCSQIQSFFSCMHPVTPEAADVAEDLETGKHQAPPRVQKSFTSGAMLSYESQLDSSRKSYDSYQQWLEYPLPGEKMPYWRLFFGYNLLAFRWVEFTSSKAAGLEGKKARDGLISALQSSGTIGALCCGISATMATAEPSCTVYLDCGIEGQVYTITAYIATVLFFGYVIMVFMLVLPLLNTIADHRAGVAVRRYLPSQARLERLFLAGQYAMVANLLAYPVVVFGLGPLAYCLMLVVPATAAWMAYFFAPPVWKALDPISARHLSILRDPDPAEELKDHVLSSPEMWRRFRLTEQLSEIRKGADYSLETFLKFGFGMRGLYKKDPKKHADRIAVVARTLEESELHWPDIAHFMEDDFALVIDDVPGLLPGERLAVLSAIRNWHQAADTFADDDDLSVRHLTTDSLFHKRTPDMIS